MLPALFRRLVILIMFGLIRIGRQQKQLLLFTGL
jgi:hypothetical protein